MADYEFYQARADEQRALDLAATTSPFTIVVRFIAGLTQRQQEAFAAAADRWVRVIVGDLPEMLVGDELIDDVLISPRAAQSTAQDTSLVRPARANFGHRRPEPRHSFPRRARCPSTPPTWQGWRPMAD